jgi:hypothetical protein
LQQLTARLLPRCAIRLQISSRFEKWDQLNDLLPPSKYPDGPGVVETLRTRRPNSCPDFAKLDEGDPGATGAGAQAGPGGRRRSLEGRGARGCAAALPAHLPSRHLEQLAVHHSGSCPRLDGWEQDELLRRKSIAVGQLLYHRQKEAEGVWEGGAAGGSLEGSLRGSATVADALCAANGGSGSPSSPSSPSSPGSPRWMDSIPTSGGAAVACTAAGSNSAAAGRGVAALLPGATMTRTRSSGELLRSARPGSLSAAQQLPWLSAAAQAFDASPLEFGRSSGGSSSRGMSRGVKYLSSRPRGPGQHAGTYAGNAYSTTYTRGPALPLHAATMVDSIGCGMHQPSHPQPSPSLGRQQGQRQGQQGQQEQGQASTRHGSAGNGSGSGGDGPGSPSSPRGVLGRQGGSALAGNGGKGTAKGSPTALPAATATATAATHAGAMIPSVAAVPPAAAAKQPEGGKKEKKGGKVKFMTRLKQRLWGDELAGGMHQPLW